MAKAIAADDVDVDPLKTCKMQWSHFSLKCVQLKLQLQPH